MAAMAGLGLGVLLAGFGMVVLLLALARYFLSRSRERSFIKYCPRGR